MLRPLLLSWRNAMASKARVIVVGAGAREHALGQALAAAGHAITTAPGNPGTEAIGRNAPLHTDDVPGLVQLALDTRADLVVVGPELPLTLGLVDALEARGVRAFGPTRAAARLEGSKAYMKLFCRRHGIPTAPFAIFDDADAAERHVRDASRMSPGSLSASSGRDAEEGCLLVVKADGPGRPGKGVVVAETAEEACGAIDRFMRRRELGAAGATVVLEERLPGEEASFHVVTDGSRAVALAPAQDHKRVFDGDRGPNTGGMGAYAPAPVVTAEVQERVLREIVGPTLAGLAAEGAPFRGVLFVGLMIHEGVPQVLEYNVRFGDPEATVLVPTYGGDWLELLDGAARGDLSAVALATASSGGSGAAMGPPRGAALSVVMAAAGYPGKPRTGDRISGLDAGLSEGSYVMHAGTARADDGSIVTNGGRVLAVGAHAGTLVDAARLAYEAVGLHPLVRRASPARHRKPRLQRNASKEHEWPTSLR